jgi:hypothetical protein
LPTGAKQSEYSTNLALLGNSFTAISTIMKPFAIILFTVWLEAMPIWGMCPFKRGAGHEDGKVDPRKLKEIFSPIQEAEINTEHAKRQAPFTTFDPATQFISVSGAHAWAPPGPGDMLVIPPSVIFAMVQTDHFVVAAHALA